MHTEGAQTTGSPRPAGKGRRRLRGVMIAVITAVVALPTGVYATTMFSDVPATNTHHDAIDAIASAGVTAGCATGVYCPGDPVRRDQMASFLDRLGALSGQPPVVNAKTAETAETAETAGTAETAETADDAAAVNGKTAEELASRVASGSFDSVSGLDATVTNVGSVTIEAPVAGTLIAHAQANFIVFGGQTVAVLGITDSATTLDLSDAGVATVGNLDSADTERRRFSASPMTVIDVAAGTHTLHLNAQRSDVFDAQNVNLGPSVLTVTFVPAE